MESNNFEKNGNDKMASPKLIDSWCIILREGSSKQQILAARALGEIGEKRQKEAVKEAVKILLEVTRHKNSYVAAKAFEYVGKDCPEAYWVLNDMLNQKNDWGKYAAASTLLKFGQGKDNPKVVETLLGLTRHEKSELALAATNTLGEVNQNNVNSDMFLKVNETLDFLLKNHPDDENKGVAERSLKKIGDIKSEVNNESDHNQRCNNDRQSHKVEGNSPEVNNAHCAANGQPPRKGINQGQLVHGCRV